MSELFHDVLAELGLSEAEIAQLETERVIGTRPEGVE